ncbi:MAG: DUF2961 domain-containing protein [Bryobacteraceae bacterium]|nr:DUF2961 domain-containing protein [Bryobacteraceae bacterium]
MRIPPFTYALAIAAAAAAQPIYVMPEGVETRWASPENPAGDKGKAAESNAGRKGRPAVPVKAGESLTLAETRGAGTVRRIWITISDRSPEMLRGLRIDMYWDGAAKAAVSAPLGDFFGTGLGRMTAFESAAFASPEGRSFVGYLPMPFRTGMKIVVTNESGKDLESLYYDVDYTIGDRHGRDALYLHAHWRRETPTTLQRDYEILPKLSGRGRYLGANLGVIANRQLYHTSWWGEGEVKVYLDGDSELPTLSGTGTEDYIGTGWGQGRYAHLYQGCHVADRENMRYCFYRYHIPDPVYFLRDVRVTIQQIGWLGEESMGTVYRADQPPLFRAGPGLVRKEMLEGGLFERQDDWSSCAYFYLDKPENSLPALAPVAERTKGLETR